MQVEDVYEHYYQNWARAMRETGLSKNTYQAWLQSGYIPMATQLKIEELTDGKLISEVNKKKKHK